MLWISGVVSEGKEAGLSSKERCDDGGGAILLCDQNSILHRQTFVRNSRPVPQWYCKSVVSGKQMSHIIHTVHVEARRYLLDGFSHYFPKKDSDWRMMPLLFFLFALLSTVQSFVPPSCTVRSPTCLADMPSNLKIIFSDVDGALIHYPKKNEDYELSCATDDNRILALPPSATGMRGIVSSKTLAACRDLRQAGTLLVLVSGMRTSTLLSRLPYLPVADAYCTEAGGRIFYPSEPLEDDDVFDGEEDDDETDSPFPFQQATPLEFSGSQAADLKAFGLREDVDWRNRMEEAAGKDGYPGNEVSSNRCDSLDDLDDECIIDYDNQYGFPKPKEVVPIDERRGALWDYAQKLQHDEGLILDTKSYSTCFRVNRKHQTAGPEKFEALLSGDIVLPPELAKSTNLGCIDIYPISSGKRNW